MTEPSRWRLWAVALATVALLTGCRTPSYLCVRASGLHTIAITSRPDSNHGRPIAVDLLYVTAKPLAATVSKLKARDYFPMREQLRRDNPGRIESRSWELQAGQHISPTRLSPPCNLAGVYLFANYGSEGDHRIAVGKAKAGALALGEDGIEWKPK